MILGALCQRKSNPSIYALDAQFNALPFVDDAGNFTITNTSVAQSSGKAIFNGGTPQYLEFIGAETFNLQQSIDIELQLTNTLLAPTTHTIFELKGSTSYLAVQILNNSGSVYEVYLTGATGGNIDNYTLTSGLTLGYLQNKTLRIVYDATLGRLRTYVDGVLDISQGGITPRVNETRTMYLSTITYTSNQLSADVDYFRIKVG